jgi:4-amino-4-deoxy-L-arabinose transferase-like glycosyltransferase
MREERGDALFGAGLFALALVPRLYVALAWAGEPVWDGHYYDFGARRIAQGLGYSDDVTMSGTLVWHPWCHYPVGYSAVLALFYRLLGSGPSIAAVLDSLTGAALAVVTWALARHALSPLRARIAGLIVALHPGLILYSALVMSEPLAALLALTAFWLAVRDASWRRGLVVGALVRPQALLCVPFLGLVARGTEVRWGRARWAVAACAIALLPVLPWTARNCRVMDGCALVSTNAGWNLAIGAFPRATGRFETLRASDGCPVVSGQVQQDRCWLDYGVHQIAAHPWHWLKLVPAKLGFTFDHESFAVEYLHEARPEAWPESARRTARDVTTLAHRLLLAAAALGCVAFPNFHRPRGSIAQSATLGVAAGLVALAFAADTPVFWPLAVFVAVVPWLPFSGRPDVAHAVFFGEDRYHLVVTPVLALLAAGALRARHRGSAVC